MPQNISLSYIGKVSSPYKEKFAIPRQPGLVSAAKGKITLLGEANMPNIVRGLEQFSHIWVLFVFHGTQQHGWDPLVRPPRLGGNKKIGVLATRSTFRPNPIGMSVVKLDSICIDDKRKNKDSRSVTLNISGLDLLDQTPVIDIKPYIPYADAHINAQASYAQHIPEYDIAVSFSDFALLMLQKLEALNTYQSNSKSTSLHDKNAVTTVPPNNYVELKLLITQILEQDPRPAYKKNKPDAKIYGMSIYNLNIQWQFSALDHINVISIDIKP